MCFYIRNTQESATLWIAKEDIVCYKFINRDMSSYYKGFTYKFNTLYKTNLKQPKNINSKGELMFK